jgi:potassium-dependent mechanosensitive channel
MPILAAESLHFHPGPARVMLRSILRCHMISLLLIVAATTVALEPASGQEAPTALTEVPGPFEVPQRDRALADAANETRRTVDAFADVSDLEFELEAMRQRLADLRVHIATVTEAEYMRPERLSRIRDQALQHQQELEALQSEIASRLEQLEELRSEWSQRETFWLSWRDSLRVEGRAGTVEGDFDRAIRRISDVVQRIEDAFLPVLEVQEGAIELREEATQSAEYVAAVRAGRREAISQRVEPVLFTRAFLEQMKPERLREWRPLRHLIDSFRPAFFAENGGILLFHVLLALVFAVVARKLRHLSIPEGAWSGLLLRWRALAIFASTALMSTQYVFAPAVWDVVLWALLAGSGAVLATRLIAVPSLRRMVYVFAMFYPAFLLAEALLTPAALFRLALAGVALIGVIHFGRLWRLKMRDAEGRKWASWILAAGSVMWFVVLVAEVFGFYLLARWVLHATISSAYVVFVVVFVIVLARGAISTLVRIESSGRLGFLRSIGAPLIERLIILLEIVLVIVAALQILDLWELTASPAETWQSLMGIGTTIAGIEITIGRVLMAFILVYLAILASWLVRTFTRTEVYPRWELERGVGESINSLVHYVLIFLGIMVGLGALGVELQNFAIVAGALGVGIGFGLQNVVNNFVSGLILLFERPVRIGDTVVVGTELGTIRKIGLRSTTVVTFDRAEVIVPNGDLVSEKVTNWTLTDPVARLILPVGVAYGTEVKRVLELLREAGETHPDVLKDPPPQTLFMAFGDSALDFELRVWVQGLAMRLKARSEILARIDELFRENDIEIPFPQRDLHLRSVDPRVMGGLAKPDTADPDDAPA